MLKWKEIYNKRERSKKIVSKVNLKLIFLYLVMLFYRFYYVYDNYMIYVFSVSVKLFLILLFVRVWWILVVVILSFIVFCILLVWWVKVNYKKFYRFF